MTADEQTWEPPGPGQWYYSAEHLPGPVSTLFAELFPLAAAVAVEHGGPMAHAAILARELGVTAVIGVRGLLDRVHEGDQVEVDPVAGSITVLDRAT